ncbi:MAG TPA: UMP kinase, partial [Synergistaceae bacterium]|nr:UMP kinase [Synergistaceae bacterium]
TKVDGVYEKDPEKEPDASFLPHISYMEALTRQLKVMDATAFSLCMENAVPIVVFNILRPGNLRRIVLDGEQVGTVVDSSKG